MNNKKIFLGLKGDLIFSGINFFFKMLINILIFSVLARIIPIEYFGLLSYFVVLATTVLTILDMGHNYLVVKDMSMSVSKAISASYVSNKVIIKGFIFGFVLILMLIFFNYKGYWNLPPFYLWIFISASFLFSLARLNFSFFYSANKYYLETISLIINLLILSIGIVGIYYFSDWKIFLLIYPIGALGMFLSSLKIMKSYFGIGYMQYFLSFDFSSLKKDFILALPFALILIGDNLFGSLDSFFVEQAFDKHDLGIYEGLKKILMGLGILGVILTTGIMPWIRRTIEYNAANAKRNILLIFSFTIITGMIIFLFYYFFNKKIITILLGPSFLEIETWDTHIALFLFSKYLRIVPAMFLILAGHHKTRLIIVYFMVLLAILIVHYYAIPFGMKYTFKVVTWLNVIIAMIYSLGFIFFLYKTPKITS